jgi:hypothetical protein
MVGGTAIIDDAVGCASVMYVVAGPGTAAKLVGAIYVDVGSN